MARRALLVALMLGIRMAAAHNTVPVLPSICSLDPLEVAVPKQGFAVQLGSATVGEVAQTVYDARAGDTTLPAAYLPALRARGKKLFVGKGLAGSAIGTRYVRKRFGVDNYLLAVKIRAPVLPPPAAGTREVPVDFTWDVGGLVARVHATLRANAKGTRLAFHRARRGARDALGARRVGAVAAGGSSPASGGGGGAGADSPSRAGTAMSAAATTLARVGAGV